MKLKEIVVVDDSEADIQYADVILHRADVTEQFVAFDLAQNALAYLGGVEGHHAELVLLDINMPEMDGFAFLAAYNPMYLRGQATAMVVMLTSSPDRRDRERALGFYLESPSAPPRRRRW